MPKKIPILDHGFIQLVESWGSDEAVICAARMSTDKGFLGWEPGECPVCEGSPGEMPEEGGCRACEGKGSIPGDKNLLKRLWDLKHSTPFEMAGATIEVQAPIFVFREWHRHRTQSFSEMSARYVPLPDFNYVPSVERLLINSKTNKQAGTIKGAEVLTLGGAEAFQIALRKSYAAAQALYVEALAAGVPKELARVHLPVGRYSRMRASANLRNWLAFLTLRSTSKGPGAQWEIRQFADALEGLLVELFPRTMALFQGAVA